MGCQSHTRRPHRRLAPCVTRQDRVPKKRSCARARGARERTAGGPWRPGCGGVGEAAWVRCPLHKVRSGQERRPKHHGAGRWGTDTLRAAGHLRQGPGVTRPYTGNDRGGHSHRHSECGGHQGRAAVTRGALRGAGEAGHQEDDRAVPEVCPYRPRRARPHRAAAYFQPRHPALPPPRAIHRRRHEGLSGRGAAARRGHDRVADGLPAGTHQHQPPGFRGWIHGA
mmetsp:Transcript_19932/g.32326  ORF Transcript_19932/g.32326 Transcript_19932/m.32326 type:complete len:225 (+) Transcript_19932:869-1543(+)